ncbi:unnamed protein product [Mycena citricolor]|uniref:YDG domain-containing protein n=1 Tax=Mycena citricolor TaxID=2018698 RepID=A0AAD2H682_9AGAR|nr:unnamed protein product [Mycena citricolor]
MEPIPNQKPRYIMTNNATGSNNSAIYIPVGTTWATRAQLRAHSFHKANTAGIYGRGGRAVSIVASGGYPDEDHGDILIYTGTGGKENTRFGDGPQVEDQKFSHPHNKWLRSAMYRQTPVHVIRGKNSNSLWAPEDGYCYDGKYLVTDAYMDKSPEDGQFMLCKFRLERVPGQPQLTKNREM